MSTTKNVSIVFYKGTGTLAEKLIRMWTKSPFSHCEFRRSDGLYHSNDRFRFISRTQEMHLDQSDWEICDISLPSEIVDRVERRQIRKNGTKYDWMGIVFSQVFRLGIHDKKRWFCSKSNADDLLYAYRLMKRVGKSEYRSFIDELSLIADIPIQNFSPEKLYQTVKKIAS